MIALWKSVSMKTRWLQMSFMPSFTKFVSVASMILVD
jgi:hypothetical protein